MDTTTWFALLVLLALGQFALFGALFRRVTRLRAEVRLHADHVIEEVRAVSLNAAVRSVPESRTSVPAGRASNLPLESETPQARRLATAPKSVIKAEVRFSNSAFEEFAKPPPAFADTQALDPAELDTALAKARKPAPSPASGAAFVRTQPR